MDHKNNEFNSRFSGVKVHPNAFVDPSAELHDGVIVSPGAIIGPDVTIGKGTEIYFCSFPDSHIRTDNSSWRDNNPIM